MRAVPELGADATINYARGNLRDALKALTDGKGPDVVYDPVGGDLAEPVFRSIAWRGRYLVVGFAQGGIPALPLEPGAAQGRLDGRRVLGRLRAPRAEGQRRQPRRAGQWYAQGEIKPVIDQRLPMPRGSARSLRAHGQPAGARQARDDQSLRAASVRLSGATD